MYFRETFCSLITFLFIAVLVFLTATPLYAAGHEKCGLCHEIVDEKPAGIKVKGDTKGVNPFTGKTYGSQDGICIVCHGGFNHKQGHVYGVKPKKVRVPHDMLGKGNQSGEVICLSCHDPHAHKNYKYLKKNVKSLNEVLYLCVFCHPKNANASTLRELEKRMK